MSQANIGDPEDGARASETRDPPLSEAARRGTRIHGGLDLAFAAAYGWLGFSVAPGRAIAWNVALAGIISLLAIAGVSLLLRLRFGRVLAIATQLALLLFCLATGALLVASAAYLRGVYGPIGKGMAIMALVATALVVELCGLLPLFQLRFLARDDVRALFAGAPPRRP